MEIDLEKRFSVLLRAAAEKLKVNNRAKFEAALKTLEIRMKVYMWNKVNKREVFGSFTRETMLPSEYDPEADIDILVIFDDKNYDRTPETYRNQLREFAEKAFQKAEIKKDFPSVVIENNSVTFDLVPCVTESDFFSGKRYFIPESSSNSDEWMETKPHGITEQLKPMHSRIRHIIRLLKYWNVTAGRPFESIELERQLVDNFDKEGYFVRDFTRLIDCLNDDSLSQAGTEKLDTLKTRAERLTNTIENGEREKADMQLKLILPNLWK